MFENSLLSVRALRDGVAAPGRGIDGAVPPLAEDSRDDCTFSDYDKIVWGLVQSGVQLCLCVPLRIRVHVCLCKGIYACVYVCVFVHV